MALTRYTDCACVPVCAAMAAKTFFRSMVGASMPMWIPPVYASIGHLWAGMIFAFLSVAMLPSKFLGVAPALWRRYKGADSRCSRGTVPFIFFYYGDKIRQRSTMAS